MSRVADAYSRVSGHDPADDLDLEIEVVSGDALSEFAQAKPTVRDDRAAFERRTRRHAAVAPAVPSSSGDSSAPVAARSGDAGSERRDEIERSLSGLIERVFLPLTEEPTRAVAFISIGRETDAGPLAATAAEMLAERTPQTVCLVDANFGAPSLHTRFGLANASGLAEVLASEAPLTDAARRLQRNLWLVTAGLDADRPLYTAAAVRRRTMQLMSEFDYVIVHAEPVSPGIDVAGLAPFVGGVILVISEKSTRRESARRATQALNEAGVTIIGAVLTNRRFPIPDALNRLL